MWRSTSRLGQHLHPLFQRCNGNRFVNSNHILAVISAVSAFKIFAPFGINEKPKQTKAFLKTKTIV